MKPSKTTVLVGVLVMADITAAFETTMVFTAIKELLGEYGRPTTVAWLITAYLLVSAAAAAICGRLGDLYGRRTLLLVVLGFALVGSILSALSSSLGGVIAGRAIQGMSGAILPLCLGLARQHVPSSQLPISLGIISGTMAIGGGLGMIVGGLVVDNLGWRYIFVASTGLALISLVLAWIFIPHSPGAKHDNPLDIIGGLLFAPPVAGALLAISNANDWAWDVRFWGLLAGSAAFFAGWVRHELRHPHPLIDVRLLLHRDIAFTNLAMALCALGAYQYSQLAYTASRASE